MNRRLLPTYEERLRREKIGYWSEILKDPQDQWGEDQILQKLYKLKTGYGEKAGDEQSYTTRRPQVRQGTSQQFLSNSSRTRTTLCDQARGDPWPSQSRWSNFMQTVLSTCKFKFDMVELMVVLLWMGRLENRVILFVYAGFAYRR